MKCMACDKELVPVSTNGVATTWKQAMGIIFEGWREGYIDIPDHEELPYGIVCGECANAITINNPWMKKLIAPYLNPISGLTPTNEYRAVAGIAEGTGQL